MLDTRQLGEDAERAVLGSIIMNRDAIVSVAAWLRPADFQSPAYSLIYRAMQLCYQARIPPDLRNVMDIFIRHKQLVRIGTLLQVSGADVVTEADEAQVTAGTANEEMKAALLRVKAGVTSALAALVDTVPTSYHVEYYARTVEHYALLRRLHDAGQQILALSLDTAQDVDGAARQAQQILNRATRRIGAGSVRPLAEVIAASFSALEDDRVGMLGLNTGFAALDRLLGGLYPGNLIIVAARPGVGKSALLTSIAYLLGRQQESSLLFSLEMSAEEIRQRLTARHTGISIPQLRTMRLDEVTMSRYVAACADLSAWPIYIDDTASLPIEQLRARVLRHIAEVGPLSLIGVDYLQLVQAAGSNRYEKITEVSRALKDLAKDVGIPVLALAQLNRSVEARQGGVPMLSDLRESGQIEQDADVVMFIKREPDSDVAELIIAKHRNGEVGTVPLHYVGPTTSFYEPDREERMVIKAR